jgi:hypothetical protein
MKMANIILVIKNIFYCFFFCAVDYINLRDPHNINWFPHRYMSNEAMARLNEIIAIRDSGVEHDLSPAHFTFECHLQNMHSLIFAGDDPQQPVTYERIQQALANVFALRPAGVNPRPSKNMCYLLLDTRHLHKLVPGVLVIE